MEPIKSEEAHGYTVELHYDDDPMSPRDWDNLGTIVTWHRNYELGDENFSGRYDQPDPTEYLAENVPAGSVVLPVYLLDHSGLSVSCGSFGDPWDSGQLGFIYVTPDKIRTEYGVKRISAALRERVAGYLKGEIQTLDATLTGQVYGYVVTNENGAHVDSCWGFYDEEEAMSEGLASAEYHAANLADSLENVRDWRDALKILATS